MEIKKGVGLQISGSMTLNDVFSLFSQDLAKRKEKKKKTINPPRMRFCSSVLTSLLITYYGKLIANGNNGRRFCVINFNGSVYDERGPPPPQKSVVFRKLLYA